MVTHPSLSAWGLWSLRFACTVLPLQGRMNFGGVGVLRRGTM